MAHRFQPWLLVALLGVFSACGDDDPEPTPPTPISDAFFPTNFRTAYDLVRDCRNSTEHGLVNIVVYTDPDSTDRYLNEDYPFEPGTVVVKEEFGDDACSAREGFTVMRKAEPGEHEDTLGWQWQSLDANFETVPANVAACVACHTDCGADRDGVCTLP